MREELAHPESHSEREYHILVLALGSSGRPEVAAELIDLLVSDDRNQQGFASNVLRILIADDAQAREEVRRLVCGLIGAAGPLERRTFERLLWQIAREGATDSPICRD